MSQSRRVMGVFSLVMINVIAVDSLRSLPFSATFGFSVVFYYLLAGIVFFIPTALISAELASAWPKTGGIYIWVREAFGIRSGLFVIWLQWIYNICWYPTIMSLLAATLAYMINPALVHNLHYMLSVVFILFISTTIVNCFGMKVSSRVSNITALVGSIFPMILITVLGIIWASNGSQIQIHFTLHSFLPHTAGLGALVLLTNVLYSLVGMEMSAIHAQDVKNPQRQYPVALLWSTILILATLIGGALAIAMIIPHNKIGLLTGMLQVFYTFFKAHHIAWMTQVIGLCIIIGGFGGVSAWVLGPSRGLMVAAQDGAIPSWLCKTNRFGAPVFVLLCQFILFAIICSVFLLMPSINSAYWILSDITAILSLMAYLLMFAAGVKLRYSHPDIPRAYKIPCGDVGIWFIAFLGSMACLVTIVIGFFPPTGVHVGSIWHYETILIGGVALFCIVPFILYSFTQRSALRKQTYL